MGQIYSLDRGKKTAYRSLVEDMFQSCLFCISDVLSLCYIIRVTDAVCMLCRISIVCYQKIVNLLKFLICFKECDLSTCFLEI